jgi:hypothetical protein
LPKTYSSGGSKDDMLEIKSHVLIFHGILAFFKGFCLFLLCLFKKLLHFTVGRL